jgi:hypothetical protein
MSVRRTVALIEIPSRVLPVFDSGSAATISVDRV